MVYCKAFPVFEMFKSRISILILNNERTGKFSPNQIARILKEFDNGKSVEEISCDYGVSTATLFK